MMALPPAPPAVLVIINLKVGRLLPPIVPVLIAIAVDDRGARWGARFTNIILFLSRNNTEILPFHQSLTISLL
jgi:hypothetical protein